MQCIYIYTNWLEIDFTSFRVAESGPALGGGGFLSPSELSHAISSSNIMFSVQDPIMCYKTIIKDELSIC